MRIKELRALCQSTAPAPENEAVMGRFCRVFSIYTTAAFLKTRITPNQITAISVGFFFLGLVMLFNGSYTVRVIGAITAIFSVILDGSDGEVARFRKSKRVSGGVYAEPVSHDIQYGLGFFLIGIALWSHTGYASYIILGSYASIIKLLYRFLETRFWYGFVHETLSREDIARERYAHKKKPLHIRAAYWINKNIYTSAALVGPLFVFTAINRLDLFLWIYAVGFTAFFLLLFVKQTRRIARERL
ncbi:MAG: CDP-alcohol phosphatidyltransferase family protein [Patescibacteria group bacterium]